MLTKYNPEHNEYTHYIPLEDSVRMQEKLQKLEERLKETAKQCSYPNKMETAQPIDLDINDLEGLKKFLGEDYKMDAPINLKRASLFLVACSFCNGQDVIRYLVEHGSSVHRVDLLGNNAIMNLILNPCMDEENKLELIAYLIDKGCDVDWVNGNKETALSIALGRLEIEIADLLLDKGATVRYFA